MLRWEVPILIPILVVTRHVVCYALLPLNSLCRWQLKTEVVSQKIQGSRHLCTSN